VADLERELRELGAALALPPVPDVAGRIAALLPERAPRRRGRRAAVVVFATLLVAVGAALAVPQARTAILEWFGLRGVSVQRVSTQPTAPVRPIDLGLGPVVGLEEARSEVAFELVDPDAIARPDEVRLSETPPGGQVAFVWRDDAGEVRLLLTQFQAGLDTEYIEKLAGPQTTVERLEVNGAPALWITGAPHSFGYRDPQGRLRDERLRLAGTTLLWERGDSVLRLEAELTRAQALALADALG
jgi:hypothetical protein